MSRRSNTRNRNRNTKKIDKKVIFTILILLLFLLFISVIFSLINMGNNKIINRVYIGDINVSNLSQEEAKEKIETWYK